MSASSGFPTSKKSLSSIPGYTSDQAQTKAQFNSLQPSGSDHVSLDTVQRAAYEVSNTHAVLTTEKRLITCTGVNAQKDDIIRFTSGVNAGKDYPVLSAPDANTIIIASEFDTAPSVADLFDLYRYTFIKVSSDGSQVVTVAPSPLVIMKDGVPTQVALDTTFPYSQVPIPVVLTDVLGSTVVNVTASDLNVSIKHNGLDPSSVRLGDGTTEVGVTLTNELKVADANLLLELQKANAVLTNGDIADYTFDNTTGQTLFTGIAKKVRIVQNGGELLYIYKNAVKIGALEAGGKIEFPINMLITDALIIKSKAGTVTTNLCWNIFA